jgi:hypothetical protein
VNRGSVAGQLVLVQSLFAQLCAPLDHVGQVRVRVRVRGSQDREVDRVRVRVSQDREDDRVRVRASQDREEVRVRVGQDRDEDRVRVRVNLYLLSYVPP